MEAEIGPALLARYREERAGQPQFYYSELADRGRALAELRPAVADFLAGRTGLADFTHQLAGGSRREVGAARGRTANRYWRFNSAGRLLLESLYKQAEQSGRLNQAETAWRAVLVAPANLDSAERQLDTFADFVEELLPVAHNRSQVGLVAYAISYFWAVQQPEWPVYERVVREQLSRPSRENEPNSRRPAARYLAFYLTFTRLSAALDIRNNWELESFLHWLARRNFSHARWFGRPSKSAARPLAKKARTVSDLQGWLEQTLRLELSENFRGQTGEDGRLIFAAPERSYRLELCPDGAGSWRAGAGFDGFSPAALATPAGEATLSEIGGFLASRPEYHFYTAGFEERAEPQPDNLAAEFWLLRPWTAQQGAANLDALVSEWRLLYPFVRRLATPFEDEIGDDTNHNRFEYNADEPETRRAVAESAIAYSYQPEYAVEQIAPVETEIAEISPAPEPRHDEAANAEVRRLASLKPPALTAEQLDGLIAFVKERLIITPEKITEVVTHLEAGRNLLLFGPPGSGKTRLARLIAGQMGATDPGWSAESEAGNYSLTTATAEWSQYDTIGGIRPGLAGESGPNSSQSLFYYFEPGVVARAALACEESLRRNRRPHYLIIDEFNRANQERAFGELFTLLEYRDRPLLAGARLGRAVDLFIPDAFRIIGTLNADDRNTLYDVGLALRRRFAMVEIGLPPPSEERRFLPRAVQARLPEIKLTPVGDFADPALNAAADRLSDFVAAVRPDPTNPKAGGKEIGTAPLIESLIFCAVATDYYSDPTEALEDAILANILPQLDRSPQAARRALAAVAPDGPLSGLGRVRLALQRLV